MQLEWEIIDEWENTYRLKVIGGWLVRHVSFSETDDVSECMCFVPDLQHEWK